MVDCKKLQHDIDGLSELKNQLQTRLDAINDTGKNKAGDAALFDQASAVQDQILERYLDDFVEQNPGQFEWSLEQVLDLPEVITAITKTRDDKLVICGAERTVYFAEQQEDGSYSLDGKNSAELNERAAAQKICVAPDGSLITQHRDGIVRSAVAADGSMDSKLLLGLEGDVETKSMAVLDNGDIIATSDDAKTYIISGEDGRIVGEIENPGKASVVPTSNGFSSLMPRGGIDIFDRQPDGEYLRSAHIESKKELMSHAYFENGDVVVTTAHGDVFVSRKNEDDASYGELQKIGDIEPDDLFCYYGAWATPFKDGKILIHSFYAIQDYDDMSNCFPFHEYLTCELSEDGKCKLREPFFGNADLIDGALQVRDDLLAYMHLTKHLVSIKPPTVNLSTLKKSLKDIAQKVTKE